MRNSQLCALIGGIWLGLASLHSPVGLGIGAGVFFLFSVLAASLDNYRNSLQHCDPEDKP